MTEPISLESLPEIKWRCQSCRAAYQELRAFRLDGLLKMDLLCHRCGKVSRVVKCDRQPPEEIVIQPQSASIRLAGLAPQKAEYYTPV